jgi:hypothetical protein
MKHQTAFLPPLDDLSLSLVDDLQAFHALKPAWEDLYRRDPDAHVFLSWALLEQAFRDAPSGWSVLLVRASPNGALLAALPLKYRVHWSKSRKEFQTELEAGSRLLGAPYTGFLCDPTDEAHIIQRIAAALTQMPWVRLTLAYAPQTSRIALLAEALTAAGCPTKVEDGKDDKGPNRRMSSIVIALPERFEDHLVSQIDTDLAETYLSWCNDLEKWEPDWASLTTPGSFENDIESLTRFFERSGDTAGRSNFDRVLPTLRAASDARGLHMLLIWSGDAIVGGVADVHDPASGALTRLLSCVNNGSEPKDLRAFMDLKSVEYGISRGCLHLDFGRVSSKKLALKSFYRERSVTLAAKRETEDPTLRFDPLCTGHALLRIKGFIGNGKLGEAKAACDSLSTLLGSQPG